MHSVKKHIIGLFIFLFLIYALLPSVCHIYISNGPVHGSLSNCLTGKSSGEKNSRGVDIIVFKTRTLVPEDGITKLTHLVNLPLSESCFSINSKQPVSFSGVSLFVKAPADGFRSLCSGLSPPTLQLVVLV